MVFRITPFRATGNACPIIPPTAGFPVPPDVRETPRTARNARRPGGVMHRGYAHNRPAVWPMGRVRPGAAQFTVMVNRVTPWAFVTRSVAVTTTEKTVPGVIPAETVPVISPWVVPAVARTDRPDGSPVAV